MTAKVIYNVKGIRVTGQNGTVAFHYKKKLLGGVISVPEKERTHASKFYLSLCMSNIYFNEKGEGFLRESLPSRVTEKYRREHRPSKYAGAKKPLVEEGLALLHKYYPQFKDIDEEPTTPSLQLIAT